MSHPTLPPLPARVAAGAALLDAREPGWHEAIDPDALGRYIPGRVLLDHLAVHFYGDDLGAALATLSDTFTSIRDRGAQAWLVAHGFASAPGEPTGARAGLTGRWQAEVRRRQATPPKPTSPSAPPAGLRPGDPLAALADHLDPPEPRALIEIEWPAAAAIVAEVHAARAVIDAARLVGQPHLDETDVAEHLAAKVAAYDQATRGRWSR